ncbi:peroxidase-like isoform X2 [Belonocnema kinseyi]|nr:peroxidase-like isoform X2 [Belonocnema kinseyi]
MAGSVAIMAVIWLCIQSLGFLGTGNSLGAYTLKTTFQNEVPVHPSSPGYDQRQDRMVTEEFKAIYVPKIDENALNSSIMYGNMLVKLMSRLEINIASAGIGLLKNSPSHSQYLYSYPSQDALEKAVDAIVAVKASSFLIQHHCRRYGMNYSECARFISTNKFEGTPLSAACELNKDFNCNPISKYRSIDGSCNNLENPKLGSALTAYRRLLFPNYIDGIQEPRHERRGIHALPNPRLVCTTMSSATEQPDASRTLVVMQWSEFILHDLAYTPVRKMVANGLPISCCQADGNWLSPRYIHPDCAPIHVPDHDPIYSKEFVRCMSYVRSLPVLRTDCSFGPVEQMNQVSHFLDGSTVYGSTMEKSRELRTFEGGQLRVEVRNNREYLPTANTEPASLCLSSRCYTAGDDRVNAGVQLAVMHTIWHREHNRIAKELARLNPSWYDELLYQEARRIVIAEIQHITFNEWLPILLGKNYCKLGVSTGIGHNHEYNSDEDPAVSNEAATAALQFLKSLKQSSLHMLDETGTVNQTLRLKDNFYKPQTIESEDFFDGIIRGLTTQSSQKMDINVVSDMTHGLFKTNGNLGLDAVSLDIQRGRDHGLPGYNYYRKYCGLPVAKNFADFLDYIPSEMLKKLRSLYNSPDDVDLVIGGMAERSVDDGILGPTFNCLISEQFSRTRRTDRFFYASAKMVYPFTPDQLANIQNVTLARVFCDNGDKISQMQRNVFLKPELGNELNSCNDFEAIPSVDLFAWAEKAKAYR